MKSLLIKLILPLTIISFTLFTKWWYASPVEAPDTMYIGFPLIFQGAGWHTSMSLQIFLVEFIVDFLVYFFSLTLAIFLVKQFFSKLSIPKILTVVLWVISSSIIAIVLLQCMIADNAYHLKRPYDVKILETGYSFIWQDIERPDYYKYFPEEKKN